MAIAFDATATSGSASASSLTFNHICTGSNLVLVVYSVHNSNTNCTTPNVSSITYNGVSLTHSKSTCKFTFMVESWYLIGPDTGTNSLVVTYSGTVTNPLAISVSYTGCSQSSQPDISDDATGFGSSPSTTTTTNNDNSMVIAGIFDGDTSTDIVPTAGQNERSDQTQGTCRMSVSDKIQATAGSVTMSASAGFSNWIDSVIALNISAAVVSSASPVHINSKLIAKVSTLSVLK